MYIYTVISPPLKQYYFNNSIHLQFSDHKREISAQFSWSFFPMIPTYMSSSSSPPFPFDLNYSSGDHYDDDDGDQSPPGPKLFFGSNSNYQAAASASSSSNLFLNPPRDQHQYHDPQFYQPPARNAV